MNGDTRRERLIKYLMIGGLLLIGVYIIYKVLLKPRKTSTTAANAQATTSADSGSTGTTPTYSASDTFVNYNVNAVNSGNQATTSGDASPITAPTTSTQSTGASSPIATGVGGQAGGITTNKGGDTDVMLPPPPPVSGVPVPAPPPPAPAPQSNPPVTPPPAPAPAFRGYTIVWGDTLSAIAARYHTTWQALYAANKNTIDSWANAHGNPIPGGTFNNIFPGEQIQVPA